MKTLWTAISVFLLLNVLALVGFLGWLRASGRLDHERVERVTDIFSLTIEQEKQQEEQIKALEEQAKQKAADLARLESVSDGPITMSERLTSEKQRDELAMLRVERLKQDIQDLQKQLELTKGQLAKQRADLDNDKKAFEQAVEQQKRLESDEHFQQTVQMCEQLKSRQVKEIFQQLMQNGKKEQVVEYLAAMQQRKAAGVLKEFKTPAEVATAADLLQRLRERGVQMDQAAEQPRVNPGGA